MPQFEERQYDVNGIATAVLTAGEGDPLLFLHGAGTATGWDALLPLAERFRLIAPVHPGFGASGDDPAIDSVHDYRRHYIALADALELEDFDVVGQSMGGWIASHLAIDHRDRVRRLVLACPWGLRHSESPTQDLLAIPPDELPLYLTADLSVFDGKVPDPPTPEFIEGQQRELASAARVLGAQPWDPKLGRWLHRISAETLILWGDADRLIPVAQAEAWAELVPNARTHVLPGVGHLIFDEARESLDVVADFLGAGVAAG
jgi:pimeloyl-ACP methyl ester carboxylesterase